MAKFRQIVVYAVAMRTRGIGNKALLLSCKLWRNLDLGLPWTEYAGGPLSILSFRLPVCAVWHKNSAVHFYLPSCTNFPATSQRLRVRAFQRGCATIAGSIALSQAVTTAYKTVSRTARLLKERNSCP